MNVFFTALLRLSLLGSVLGMLLLLLRRLLGGRVAHGVIYYQIGRASCREREYAPV